VTTSCTQVDVSIVSTFFPQNVEVADSTGVAKVYLDRVGCDPTVKLLSSLQSDSMAMVMIIYLILHDKSHHKPLDAWYNVHIRS
jgi:hypothetical protein